MKTQQILLIAIIIMAPFFVNAQGGVGINTDTPRSTLEINGSLRIDSVKPIKNPKRIAVLSDSNTVDYVSIDSLIKLFSKPDSSDLCDLDGKSITELFFSTPGIYSDNCNQLVGGTNNTNSSQLLIYDNVSYVQFHDMYLDWSTMAACYSRLKVGSNIFVNLFSGSSEQRIYRYTYSSLSSGGTLVPFIGQSIPNPPYTIVRMYYDGTYHLFDYKAGNNSNRWLISRYNFNGSSFVYIDDINFVPPLSLSNFYIYSLQKSLTGFYYLEMYLNANEVSISKYNLDGSYTGEERRIYVTGYNKLNLVSIGGTLYLYYNNNDGSNPIFRKFNLF